MTVREEIKYALQESEMMNRGQSIDKIIEDASKMSQCPATWVREIYEELKREYIYSR
jgi:hypothetical protein